MSIRPAEEITQCIYLFFISYEQRTVSETADVRG